MVELSVNRWRRLVSSLVFVAAATVICGPTIGSVAEDETVTRKVIARVNAEPIYEDQIQRDLNKNLLNLKRYGASPQDDQLVKRLQLRLLDRVIGNMLVNQASEDKTVEDIDAKVEQRIEELKNKYGRGAGMEKYLTLRRITMDDLRKSLKVRVRLDEYLEEKGVLDPEIPEERIRQMYETDPQSFSTRATVTASHILIAVDAEAKDQARQQAEQIRKEILTGKDFAELAKKHSNCDSATRGGSLGVIKQGYMPAAFDKAAFALEKGKLSEVVQTQHGFHIIKVSKKVPSEVVPYEHARDILKQYLQKDESRKLLAAHIAELRKSADIEILLK